MFRIINYINIFIFSFFLILVLTFDSFKKISTKLETLIPNGEKKELLQEFGKFESTKKLFLAYKGFGKDSLKEAKELEKKFLAVKGITQEKLLQNKNLQKYQNSYRFYKEKINNESLNNLNISKTLSEIKKNMINNPFSFTLDTQDPLKLFDREKQRRLETKNGHLVLKDYGYLSIFTLDSSVNTMEDYERIYDNISALSNDKTKVFSPIFYFVENSREIKHDVNKIIFLSTIVLILLYLVILKNIKLLFNTLLTLGSSILLSLLITTSVFQEVSIFVIVFGISISTVAIDYMFHHSIHKYYERKKTFNRDVFFGMITTVGAFFIISFISFDLIKQICYFAMISLLYSYLQFSLVYQQIRFPEKKKEGKKEKGNISFETARNSHFYIKPIVITITSLIIIFFTVPMLKFDFNLKNLDTENIKLHETENFFRNKLDEDKRISVLLKANTLDELINSANDLKSKYKDSYIPLSSLVGPNEFKKAEKEFKHIDFKKIKKELLLEASKLGFKQDIFNLAYNLDEDIMHYDIQTLKSFGLEITQFNNSYLSYALVPTEFQDDIYKLDYVQSLSVKRLFEDYLGSIYQDLFLLGTITVLFIFLMLLFICRKNYFKAINYILFPLGAILMLSTVMVFNILHLFMLFIILAIGIDFGIYVSSKHVTKNTRKAIFYSLISTFSGFGVLIFSNINALFSIGIIATTGILSIMFLVLTSKRVFNDIESI